MCVCARARTFVCAVYRVGISLLFLLLDILEYFLRLHIFMHVRDILHESTLLAMHASIRYNMPRSHTYEDYVLMGSISMDSLLC